MGKARESVHVQAYVLTSRWIAKILRDAPVRGVEVEILVDRAMLEMSEKSPLPLLAEDGIPVWLETRYGAAHSKVMLIDAAQVDGVLITGSYNFI